MSQPQAASSHWQAARAGLALGVPGCLALLGGAVGQAVFAPLWMLAPAVLIAALLASRFAPAALRPLLRPGWLALCFLLVLPMLFFRDPAGTPVEGGLVTIQGAQAAGHALLRMTALLLAVSLLAAQVEISALAGVFERLGLRGLGFSLGVALNLLPGLRQSAETTWRVLQMRGGFRRQSWHGLRLLALTVLTQALQRAEEIALAAEARAFTPERAAGYPIPRGSADGLAIATGIVCLAAALAGQFLIR